MTRPDISGLEALLGYQFHGAEVLRLALTHRSHAYETRVAHAVETEAAKALPQDQDNELLEFLGDAVLSLITAQFLMERFPEKREGELSKLRAHLVSARHLARVAQALGLGEYLRLGRGEERSGGRHKSALLANTLEAVLAALYLDGGMETARLWARKTIIEPELAQLEGAGLGALQLTDYKSALQEAAQAMGWAQPRYRTTKEVGPGHKKVFTVEVELMSAPNHAQPAAVQARAEGPSKKSAEQHAARQALGQLQSQTQRAEATP